MHQRRGLTLSEVAVAIIVSMILFGIMVPAILRARDQARNQQCKNNLKEIGETLIAFSSTDPKGRYCTGAFSYLQDGSPDTFGWVADVRNTLGRGDVLLCPANPLARSETYADMIQAQPQIASGLPKDRVGVGKLYKKLTSATSDQARRQITNLSIDDGYNTNYAASWYLTRSHCLLDQEGFEQAGHFRYVANNCATLKGSFGGLRSDLVQRSKLASSIIPLMSDAASTGSGLARSHGMGPAVVNDQGLIETLHGSSEFGSPEYMILAGRYQSYHLLTHTSSSLTVGTTVTSQLQTTFADQQGVTKGRIVLQDTRMWRATHENRANVLMTDGSVQVVYDENGDGLFNPGFPVDSSEAATNGYVDGLCEIGYPKIYSGPFILQPRVHINWGD